MFRCVGVFPAGFVDEINLTVLSPTEWGVNTTNQRQEHGNKGNGT